MVRGAVSGDFFPIDSKLPGSLQDLLHLFDFKSSLSHCLPLQSRPCPFQTGSAQLGATGRPLHLEGNQKPHHFY